jgi:hypothetical protein
MIILVNQIEKREEKYPDDVDQMPVKASRFKLHVRILVHRAACDKDHYEQKDDDPNNDVERMQSRHHKIESKIQYFTLGFVREIR